MREVYRLGNPGKILVILIETQVGRYLEEDDIVRLKDDYYRDYLVVGFLKNENGKGCASLKILT